MRTAGYAPIEDYAVIGDGRTAALVARDGSIDWLCLPNFDSSSVCAASSMPHGGVFELQPRFRSTPRVAICRTRTCSKRSSRPTSGSVRLVDAMTLPDDHLQPMRELVRSIEGLSGTVPMRWRFAPRFNYGSQRRGADGGGLSGRHLGPTRSRCRAGMPARRNGGVWMPWRSSTSVTAAGRARALRQLRRAADLSEPRGGHAPGVDGPFLAALGRRPRL